MLPVLQALGTWGQAELGERRPTDAVRAHWFALPLLRALEGEGLVEVRLDEGCFHVHAGATEGPAYGDGPAPAVRNRAMSAFRLPSFSSRKAFCSSCRLPASSSCRLVCC